MKRLLEREFSTHSVEGQAQALLGAGLPERATPGMKQRVRARLFATPSAPGRRVPRSAWAAAVVLAASVAAAAGVTGVLRAGSSSAVKLDQERRPAPPAPRNAVKSETAPSAPSATSLAEPPSEAAAQAAAARAAGPAASHAAPKADEISEANLLFEATRALRREGDPGRAAQLLSQYSRQFPHGALAEEALALSLEAAQARGDRRAVTLAKRYLKTYPHGHFVDKAERVLERNGE